MGPLVIFSLTVLFLREISGQTTAMLGQPCDPANQNPANRIFCADPFGECVGGRCGCRTGYVQNGLNCVMQQPSRRSRLNGPCDRDTDCAVPWAFCKNRKCECRPKYVKDGSTCKPWRYYCPYGAWNDPLKANGNAVECISYPSLILQRSHMAGGPQLFPRSKRQAVPPLACPKMRVDNCPTGSYCNPILPEDTIPPGVVRKGVCCWKPKPMCPSGDPLSTDPTEDCSLCPRDTHFCFCDQLTNVAACCPRVCPMGNLYDNGQCAPPGGAVMPDTSVPCKDNKECMDGARCLSIPGKPFQKQCTCPGALNYIDGFCTDSPCRSGYPEMTGNLFKRCSATQDCSANYDCDITRRICCPK